MSSTKNPEKTKTLPKGQYGRGRYAFIWISEKIEVYSQSKKMILRHNTDIQIEESTEHDSIIKGITSSDNTIQTLITIVRGVRITILVIFAMYFFHHEWFIDEPLDNILRTHGPLGEHVEFVLQKDVATVSTPFQLPVEPCCHHTSFF